MAEQAKRHSDDAAALAEVEAAIGKYWDTNIEPTVADLPDDGRNYLRRRYIEDVKANPVALRQIVPSASSVTAVNRDLVRVLRQAAIDCDDCQPIQTVRGMEDGKAVHARQAMLDAVNEYRRTVGRVQVTIAAVERCDWLAAGRPDWVEAFAEECAELAVGTPR